MMETTQLQSPAKRRRLSPPGISFTTDIPSQADTIHNQDLCGKIPHTDVQEENGDITMDASRVRLAGRNVAPFLAKHIPDQYAPLGAPEQHTDRDHKNHSSKFCYRHRPDLKCRRQANEPTMDQLQHEIETLPQADQQGVAHVWTLFSAAPSKQRQLMLQGILTQCCFPQLSYLSARVRELIRIDFLSALPTELAYKILCYLDTTSLCKAAQVSQRWRSVADDDVVWHRMCEQHIDTKCTKCGWGLPLLERKRLRASKRQIQLRATGRGMNMWSPNITPVPEDTHETRTKTSSSESSIFKASDEASDSDHLHVAKGSESYFTPRYRPWKDVYKDRFQVSTNWKYGRCSIKTFRGHTNGVMCLQFDDNILATGSYDSTIKIWDIETGKELRTLRGHTSGIRCLQFDDTKLISGSIDRTLKVWNWRTGECISTYSGHNGGVISLHFDATILASGSVDTTVKIWNFEDKSRFVLRGHTDWVNAVKVDSASRTVFSASDDCTIRLWDLDTKSTMKTYKGHVGQVQQVLPLPKEFDFGETDADHHHAYESDDSLSNASNQDGIASPNPSATSPFVTDFAAQDRALPPRYMLTGALDSTIRLWNVHTGQCLRTFFGHVEGIWALAADTLRVASGSEDRTTKVWDARSGGCERTYTGHLGPVTCIGLSDSRMCTGSEDCEVRMYSFKSEVGLEDEGGAGV